MNSLVFPYEAENLFVPSFFMPGNSSVEKVQSSDFFSYIWEQFLSLLEKEKGKRIVDNWFKSLEFLDWNAQKKTVHIYAPNTFIKNWLDANFTIISEKIFARLLHEEKVFVCFVLSKKISHSDGTIFDKKKTISDSFQNHFVLNEYKNFLEFDINPYFTMEQFLVLKSNETVISAIQYFVEIAQPRTNILFISGKSHTGKTHLLQAMRELFLKKGIDCLYVHAENFLKQYIHAAKTKKIDQLERLFLSPKILMIDNIEILENKKYTQQFLAKILHGQFLKHGKVILTSKALIKELGGLTRSIIEKLESGLFFQFGEFSKKDIKDILSLKVKFHEYKISDDLLEKIAYLPGMNLTQCENILHRIMTESIIKKKKITAELLEEALNQLKSLDSNCFAISLKDKNTDMQLLSSQIKKVFSIEKIDILKKTRNQKLVKIKYLVIYVMKEYLQWSSVSIAKFFLYKDHTTISYAIERFKSFYQDDEDIKKVLLFYDKKS
jgi:chromosomal replication initiator protein